MSIPGPAESWRRQHRYALSALLVVLVITVTAHVAFLLGLLVAVAVAIAVRLGFLAADRLH